MSLFLTVCPGNVKNIEHLRAFVAVLEWKGVAGYYW
jgi:hypothetical protein